ncbi:LysR substrate-binding domain-containing protein [Aeromonas enteropelogenes]|uniref:LysR substrate-binding domain-containing protein n=1 Tax=Aeromonas enteropelogenes TaxID=29489 RepID=UPI003B9DD5E7
MALQGVYQHCFYHVCSALFTVYRAVITHFLLHGTIAHQSLNGLLKMSPRKRRLPPLKSLLALEGVLRTGSVTQAAAELSVTHSAISKQLSLLEEWLGVPLFEDRRRKMIPVNKVVTFAQVLTTAFDGIQSALDELTPEPSNSLIVIAPATLAMRWLIPRLPQFTRQYSTLDIRVHPMHSQDSQEQLPFDLAITRVETGTPISENDCAFTEQLSLVLSPRLYSDVLSREQLSKLPLLQVMTRNRELERWLAGVGLCLTQCHKSTMHTHLYQAYDAMLAGHGALVVPTFLVEELLYRGDVVEPFPEHRIEGATYVISTSSSLASRAASHDFTPWLITCFQQSGLAQKV